MESRRIFFDFLGVTVGAVLAALGLDLFLVPFKIAAGGLSGVATILYYVLRLPVGTTMLVLNIPLFILGLYRLGTKPIIRSLYGTVALSLAIDLLAPYVSPPTHNLLLAAVFGGVVEGLGLGLVFRYRGTTGGTDLAAAVIRSYTGVNVGQLLFLVDAVIALLAGVVFASTDLTMYALITIFITSWVVDQVQEGLSYAKAFFIISPRVPEIAGEVMEGLGRGATAWNVTGMYTGQLREMLLVVVNRAEVTRLKDIVYNQDPSSFVILADVHEVLGEGFKKIEKS
ncbi:MAG TPA: YitT family protein [Spirochaetia bacterium]|nr:YitT family protein [Spirochaetia bacterium]